MNRPTSVLGPRRQGLALLRQFFGRGRTRNAAIVLAVTWGTLSMMLLLAFGEGLRTASTPGAKVSRKKTSPFSGQVRPRCPGRG